MSEYKDSKYSKKDSDFDLGDIAGDVAASSGSKTTPRTKNPFESLKNKSTTEPLKKKIDDHLDENWICFIQDGKIVDRELKYCTAEEFGAWLSWVYPPAIKILEKNIDLYKDHDKRKKEYMNLIAFLTRLPKIFEQYGEKKVFPRYEETKKKAGGTDE